jgi:hypothetical protein
MAETPAPLSTSSHKQDNDREIRRKQTVKSSTQVLPLSAAF